MSHEMKIFLFKIHYPRSLSYSLLLTYHIFSEPIIPWSMENVLSISHLMEYIDEYSFLSFIPIFLLLLFGLINAYNS